MKTALIVDDSAVARAVLRKLLGEHGVAVDEASSAEAAIDYLESERPDVVFLDHLMPGMDGFEALQAIKANPDTATIPVMMYTSQDGQLYVSQARALGAVDVLPKNLSPADVKRLLCSHHLLSEDSESEPGNEQHAQEVEHTVRDVEVTAQDIVDTAPNVHMQEMTELLRSMIREQTETLLAELRAQPDQIDAESAILPPPAAIRPQETRFSFLGRHLLAVTVVVIGVAAGFGSLYMHASHLLGEANGRLQALSTLPEFRVEPPEVTAGPALPGKSASTDVFDLEALNRFWVEHYAFDAIPLDDDRALQYGSILTELRNEGFAGTVILDIHDGLFCLNYTSAGNVELAPPEQPAFACDQIGTPTETVSYPRQSAVFSDVMAVARRDGQFSIETLFHGAARPIVEYPVLDYSVTAGDWNSIAAFNQRVSFRLSRAGSDVRSSGDVNLQGHSNQDERVARLVP